MLEVSPGAGTRGQHEPTDSLLLPCPKQQHPPPVSPAVQMAHSPPPSPATDTGCVPCIPSRRPLTLSPGQGPCVPSLTQACPASSPRSCLLPHCALSERGVVDSRGILWLPSTDALYVGVCPPPLCSAQRPYTHLGLPVIGCPRSPGLRGQQESVLLPHRPQMLSRARSCWRWVVPEQHGCLWAQRAPTAYGTARSLRLRVSDTLQDAKAASCWCGGRLWSADAAPGALQSCQSTEAGRLAWDVGACAGSHRSMRPAIVWPGGAQPRAGVHGCRCWEQPCVATKGAFSRLHVRVTTRTAGLLFTVPFPPLRSSRLRLIGHS